MPFTAAHPAIILPLLQIQSRWLSTTGLVVGSIAPDFEYFITLGFSSYFSHSVLGILCFNLPISFLIATIFHLLVRDVVIKYLPAIIQKRVAAVKPLDWLAYLKRHWFIFMVSALVGACSHIFWDDFTHVEGYSQRILPVLRDHVTVYGKRFYVARIIQHASTLVGGLLVAAYVWRMPSVQVRQTASPIQKVVFWLIIPLLAAAFLTFSYFTQLTTNYTKAMVITFLSGLLLATILVSLFVKVRRG